MVDTNTSPLLLALPAVRDIVGGMSRSSIYEQIQGGTFPKPVKIGRSSRWLASEIHAWVETQASARSPKTAG